MGSRSLRTLVIGLWGLVVGLTTFVVGDLRAHHAAAAPPGPAPYSQGSVCLADTATDLLGTLFDSAPGNVIGADYQRATPLPDGRVFWMFQDAIVRLPNGTHQVVHNIAIVQDGNCFDVRYGGTHQNPDSFIFGNGTIDYGRWFWPLGATVGADGLVYIFAAEMVERGSRYLEHTEPIATRVAVFDPATDQVLGAAAPADASAALYGWSITSDDSWTYLYAQCHRQFGWQPFVGYDRTCSAIVTVARVPKGQPLHPLQYWNGTSWGSDAAAAAPVVTTQGRRINADQFVVAGNRFWSVNKEGDWWGDTVYLSWSRSPTGPFTVYRQLATQPKCDGCNTYFASWIPPAAVTAGPGELAFAISNNQWHPTSPFTHYQPAYRTVTVPPYQLDAGRVLKVPVGRDVAAAVLNITTVGPSAPGFITAYPCDQPRPTVSNVNYRAPGGGTVVANSAIVRPDSHGDVCVYSLATTDLVVDLAGTFPVSVPGVDGFTAEASPSRLLDTRTGGGAPVAAGGVVTVNVAPGTEAAAVNITAVDVQNAGYLTAYGCADGRPDTSTVNYGAPGSGAVTANAAVVRPDASGAICIFSTAPAHVLVDVAGRFSATSGFESLDRPQRLLDTRIGFGNGVRSEFRRVLAGETLALRVATPDVADPSIEHELAAVALNVTAVNPAAAGFITVHPCDVERPTTSNLNFQTPGNVTANLVIARPDADGYVCLYSLADVDLVVDITGSFPLGDAVYQPLAAPTRLLDTRVAGLSRS